MLKLSKVKHTSKILAVCLIRNLKIENNKLKLDIDEHI